MKRKKNNSNEWRIRKPNRIIYFTLCTHDVGGIEWIVSDLHTNIYDDKWMINHHFDKNRRIEFNFGIWTSENFFPFILCVLQIAPSLALSQNNEVSIDLGPRNAKGTIYTSNKI